MSIQDEILAAWAEGLAIPEIMSKVGLGRSAVYQRLKNAGISISYDRGCLKSEMPVIAPLAPMWAAEFRGLFFGEGCAMINLSSGKTKKHFQPMLRITLRADDFAVLEDIRERLGGGLADRDYSTQPSAPEGANPGKEWYVVGWGRCRAVIEATGLAMAYLPCKKAQDIAILYEAILARYQMPHLLGPENRATLMAYRERLQQVKKFHL